VSQPRRPQSIWLELYSFRFAVNNFEHEASKAKLDLTADSEETLRKQSRLKRWDRKKKKMVAVNMVSNCVSLCIKSFDLVVSLHSCVSVCCCCATITGLYGAESYMVTVVLLLCCDCLILCDLIAPQGHFTCINFLNVLQNVSQVFQFES
jgi:hypothetical protein